MGVAAEAEMVAPAALCCWLAECCCTAAASSWAWAWACCSSSCCWAGVRASWTKSGQTVGGDCGEGPLKQAHGSEVENSSA